jgi:hypothetical protein
MLAIENAEIGRTLIALSIPGLKPLIDRVCSKVGELRLSHLRSSNFPNPSAVFASEASKDSVIVGDSALQPSRNAWAWTGCGGLRSLRSQHGDYKYDPRSPCPHDPAEAVDRISRRLGFRAP